MMQKTIKQTACCTGVSITGQTYTTVTFQPAPPDTGIIFIREDLPGKPEVPCRPEYARVDARWTSLVHNDIRIEHTEHLLAAIAGLGLDNLKVSLSSPFIPVVSSFSSRDFVQTFLKAEPVLQDVPKRCFSVQEPVCIANPFFHQEKRYDRFLLALPAPELTLTYLLDYPDKEIPTQLAHFTFGNSLDFASELATARSYILENEYETVVKLIGKSIEDCLVISKDPINLQWANEPARHKVLDLLGDLYTLGRPINGHFIGIRTGHKDNNQLCHQLKMQIKEELFT
ncbi:UDP-3-O-acyl-N-acetylglucosamine deacetylase [Sporomusa silvacetica DSM 10669]|uniref:UDP-3-O-acyl-N-acetylglucosamine deacetylase n=1 Tax=Sporomusa silvacetica DSM 10669 TaxID=1123289 RepID=A0ABZ3IVK9_9FIRM|nr:UDP-3-O-acyl-N-acetylglucosamine deacetylase [Sporomusa silvacetica]OZC15209.1 UDP-3-O-[3-hydroxymyristoyl] N-acetylglucosamine deacetylase [Sporomusa silvacetica DSM 10669]